MKVILDTSFILDCLREKFDFTLADEYGELVLPREVIAEIEKLASSRSLDSGLAKLAIKIINNNRNKFEIIELGNRYVDSGIISYAEGKNVLVATMDRALKKQVRKRLVLRAKKKLWVEG